MAGVVRLAVEVEIVVAAGWTPVGTPGRVPELTGTPVVVGKRPGKGLGDARRSQTGKP